MTKHIALPDENARACSSKRLQSHHSKCTINLNAVLLCSLFSKDNLCYANAQQWFGVPTSRFLLCKSWLCSDGIPSKVVIKGRIPKVMVLVLATVQDYSAKAS
eukprot:2817428-Amphidinium_carterae.1